MCVLLGVEVGRVADVGVELLGLRLETGWFIGAWVGIVRLLSILQAMLSALGVSILAKGTAYLFISLMA